MSNNEMDKWNLGCIKTMFIHGLNCTSPSSITIINVLSINVVIKNCPASLRLFLNKGRTYEYFFYCTQEARKSL